LGDAEPLRIICGPTGAGKSALAARIEEAAREKLGHALDAADDDLMSEQLTSAPPG